MGVVTIAVMISSLSNPKVKYVRRLQSERRFRNREQVFVIEGTRWFTEIDDEAIVPKMVFFTEQWAALPGHIDILQQLNVPGQAVSDTVMQEMSDTNTPPGILAVLPMVKRPFPSPQTFLLILDAIQTPGNLGAMLRTAAAAGVDGVILAPGCVDPTNPKVVRGSMGALLRLPVRQLNWDEIATLTSDMDVWVAAIDGEMAYTAVSWTNPTALIIGSEAHGANPQARQIAGGGVTIPMHKQTESLNAAMAAGIILFEAKRQRDQKSRD